MTRMNSSVEVSSVHTCYHCTRGLAQFPPTETDWSGLHCVNPQCPTVGTFITREAFEQELRVLGARLTSEGKPLIGSLLREGERHENCRFENWPAHLKAEAYELLGYEQVTLFRRTREPEERS